jgi:transcriptional regulator with XRE-family HTH domain
MPYTPPTHVVLVELVEFGRALRAARLRVHMSQMTLEERSGVDQTLISRLERGKAAHCALDRLLALHSALGQDLPMGVCRHDHGCQFRAVGQPAPSSTRHTWMHALRSRD